MGNIKKKEIVGDVFNGYTEMFWVGLKTESIISEEFDAELELTLFEHFKGKKVKITIEELTD